MGDLLSFVPENTPDAILLSVLLNKPVDPDRIDITSAVKLIPRSGGMPVIPDSFIFKIRLSF